MSAARPRSIASFQVNWPGPDMAHPSSVAVVLTLAGRDQTTATLATGALPVGGWPELRSCEEGRGGHLGAPVQLGHLDGLLGQDQGDHGAGRSSPCGASR